jgi:hypothetical protein
MQLRLLESGQPISFGADGNFRDYAQLGWSLDSDAGTTWTDGHVSNLRFRAPLTRQLLVLRFSALPFLVRSVVEEQEAMIFLNGQWLSYFRTARPVDHACDVERDLLSSRSNVLSFVLPRATSPLQLGMSTDQRKLALAFKVLTLGPQPALQE